MAELVLGRARGIEGFEKVVVLKRIKPELARDGEFVRMFLDEARLAALLVHSNIVQVYDVGKEGEDYFIAMEYVHGVDLHVVAKAAQQQGAPAPLEASLQIATGVAAGLHYAHERVASDVLRS